MRIDGATRLTGLLGSPVSHSLSPAIHNCAFKRLGLNVRYLNFETGAADFKAAFDAMKALGALGFNVTMPCKEEAARYADELTAEAAITGAVNTVKLENGKAYGHNTDGRGFVAALEDAGVAYKDKHILIFGAGATARAVGCALAAAGAGGVSVCGRDAAKAARFCELINANTDARAAAFGYNYDSLKNETAVSDILVNCTSLGTPPHTGLSPLPHPELFLPRHTVLDVAYGEPTQFLLTAAAAGCRTLDGSGMLLYQAALAFHIWTGMEMPVAYVRKRVFPRAIDN